MKTLNQVCFLVAVALVAGCAPISVSTRTVMLPGSLKQGDVIEAAITAARDVQFPPATKIDKPGGIVEFGTYELPALGTTAQVRVKTDTEAEVNVRRGSAYIPLSAEQQADAYKAKFEERLKEAAEKGK